MNEKLKNLLPYGIVKKKTAPFFGEEASETPELFNSKGEKVKIFYLRNALNAHTPYSMVAGRIPDRILWDRFNEGLPIHFYNHRDMLDPSDKAKRRFGVLRESESIVPGDYSMLLDNPQMASEFYRIFTHNEEILNKYSNASFVPAYGVWYGTKRYGGVMDPGLCEKKTKEISVISSDKQISEYHKIRYSIAKKYMNDPKVDGYGKACGNYIEKKADALTDYRYSIVVENGSSSFYFTEKILDCFASMTVPIYLGATKIGDFFNTDGIITIDRNDPLSLDDIIASCSEKDYRDRLPAIRDNYQRVQKYLSFEDYILDNYSDMFEL